MVAATPLCALVRAKLEQVTLCQLDDHDINVNECVGSLAMAKAGLFSTCEYAPAHSFTYGGAGGGYFKAYTLVDEPQAKKTAVIVTSAVGGAVLLLALVLTAVFLANVHRHSAKIRQLRTALTRVHLHAAAHAAAQTPHPQQAWASSQSLAQR